jgi:hypothetical protein
MSELETTAVATVTAEICESILSNATLACQDDAEELAHSAMSLGEGCNWLIGDIANLAVEKLVKDSKDFRDADGEYMALPSKPAQIRDILAGISARCGVAKRTIYYARAVSEHWPTWPSRCVGTLKHTCFIRAWELTDDPDFWIDMAKAAVPPWTPTQLVEEIRAAMGEEEIGSPITITCLVNKIPFEDSEQLLLSPLDHEMIPFNPEGLAFKVRFTKLNPEKVNARNRRTAAPEG